jgi:hypothetical protein
MSTDYFKRFCANISDSDQCRAWAEETERGERTQESLYEQLLSTYGEEAVAQAHIVAANEPATTTEPQPVTNATIPTGRGRTPTAQQEPIRPSPITAQQKAEVPVQTATAAAAPAAAKGNPGAEAAIMQKVQDMQMKKDAERRHNEAQRRINENEQRAGKGISTPKAEPPPQTTGHIPAAPSNLDDVCKVCVTPPLMAILEVLKLWYTGDDAKFIEDIVDRVGDEDILLEEALAQVFIKDQGSLDGIERTLQDFNNVLAEALRIAATKSPELKARFDRERAELKAEDEYEIEGETDNTAGDS